MLAAFCRAAERSSVYSSSCVVNWRAPIISRPSPCHAPALGSWRKRCPGSWRYRRRKGRIRSRRSFRAAPRPGCTRRLQAAVAHVSAVSMRGSPGAVTPTKIRRSGLRCLRMISRTWAGGPVHRERDVEISDLQRKQLGSSSRIDIRAVRRIEIVPGAGMPRCAGAPPARNATARDC